ncbi:MAG: hypothetical protein RR678_11540, partial [Lachnospiraceae bacterium]
FIASIITDKLKIHLPFSCLATFYFFSRFLFRTGVASAVSIHRNELTNKINAFAKCAMHAAKAGCSDLPQLPQI